MRDSNILLLALARVLSAAFLFLGICRLGDGIGDQNARAVRENYAIFCKERAAAEEVRTRRAPERADVGAAKEFHCQGR